MAGKALRNLGGKKNRYHLSELEFASTVFGKKEKAGNSFFGLLSTPNNGKGKDHGLAHRGYSEASLDAKNSDPDPWRAPRKGKGKSVLQGTSFISEGPDFPRGVPSWRSVKETPSIKVTQKDRLYETARLARTRWGGAGPV